MKEYCTQYHCAGDCGKSHPGTWMEPPAKRPRGRPAVPEDQRLISGSIRLTAAQWLKLAALGDGVWLRKQIDRAKVKPLIY